MSTVWFTSDLHIGHDKVALERTRGMILPAVVGAHITAHDAILATNWDAVVGKDDLVWVLGDISSGTTSGTEAALQWISERKGRKRCILGNHCPRHPMYRDAAKWSKRYNEVFEYVDTAARIRIPLPIEGHLDALLSHFPYTGDHTATDRHTQWRLRDEGLYLLHGHTHSSEVVSWTGCHHVNVEDCHSHERQIHVGVDAWNFTPVSMSTVCDLIWKLEGVA